MEDKPGVTASSSRTSGIWDNHRRGAIAIGNPPYVRQEKIRHLKPVLKEEYASFTGTADLYVYFYERAVEMLANGGVLSFISSNKFFRSGYGKPLRAYLTRNTTLRHVIDFGDAPVFTAIAYPTILVACKKEAQDCDSGSMFHAMTWKPGPEVADFVEIYARERIAMSQKTLRPEGWRFEPPEVLGLLDKIAKAGTPLGDYVNGRFFRGVLTGLNEAFVVDRATRDRLIAEDPKSEEILKPFLRGRDVKRWNVQFADQYLIKIESSENKKHPWSGEDDAEAVFAATYPAIHKWLDGFRDGLIKRCDQGKYFWELRACVYWQEFERPKVIYPDIYEHQSFAWDEGRFFSVNTTYFIPTDEHWLVALLNSTVIEWFYGQISNRIRGGYLRAFSDYMKRIPIPPADKQTRSRLESLARQAAEAETDARADLEGEIDQIVYRLYGLTKAEIAIVEGNGA